MGRCTERAPDCCTFPRTRTRADRGAACRRVTLSRWSISRRVFHLATRRRHPCNYAIPPTSAAPFFFFSSEIRDSGISILIQILQIPVILTVLLSLWSDIMPHHEYRKSLEKRLKTVTTTVVCTTFISRARWTPVALYISTSIPTPPFFALLRIYICDYIHRLA